MKILEIITTLSSGGAERLVVDLSNELAELGHDVCILTIKDVCSPEYGFYLPEVSSKIKIINIAAKAGINFSEIKKIEDAIYKTHADITHIHFGMSQCLTSILKYHKYTNFVFTIHCDIDYIFKPNSLVKRICNAVILKILAPLWKMPFVAISSKNQSDMKKKHPRIDTRLVYNGRKRIVPSSDYEKVKSELDCLRKSENSLILLHVARCSEQKNQVLLIECFNRLVEKGFDAELIVIGNGYKDTELGHNLKNTANKNVHFLGERRNVGDYFLQADAFCLSSSFEGMPITIIEAQLCGLPILSTPVCGAVDVIKNRYNGIISESMDKEDYFKAMKELISNLSILKNNCLNNMENNRNDIHSTAKGYLEIFYQQLQKTK